MVRDNTASHHPHPIPYPAPAHQRAVMTPQLPGLQEKLSQDFLG